MKYFYTPDNKRLSVAESFQEIKPAAIPRVLELQLTLQAARSDAAEVSAKISIVCSFVAITESDLRRMPQLYTLKLFSLCRWAFNGRLTHRPFDYFKFKGIKYYLPETNLAYSSMIEVCMAAIHYGNFARPDAPVPASLPQLIATICRPRRRFLFVRKRLPNFDGDQRVPYDSLQAERTAKLFAKLPVGLCAAVLQYFEHEFNKFLEFNKKLFDGTDEAPLYPNGEGWIALCEDVATANVHGNFQQVCATNVHTIFLYLKHQKIKAERAEKEAERQNEE